MSIDEKLRDYAKYSLQYEYQERRQSRVRAMTYGASLILILGVCYQIGIKYVDGLM